MRRLTYMLVSLVMAMSLTAATATADYEWCAEDPVFNIRGTVFRLTTSIQASAADVTGLTYEVTLPADARGVTTVAYPQGRRLPTTVNVTYSDTPSSDGAYFVSASVFVHSPASAAVKLVWSGPSVPAGSMEGSTNSTIATTFTASK